MNLTILADNQTRIDKYLLAEPALCFYIEIDDKKILFDLGYSDVFIKNAQKLKIDLADISDIVFSHSHNDHTGGLFYLRQYFADLAELNIKFKKPLIIAHEKIFEPKIDEQMGNVGCPLNPVQLEKFFKTNLINKSFEICKNLWFLGEIKNNSSDCPEESALAYKSQSGLTIITGCSHSGLKNILEHAKNVLNEEKIFKIIGGFHLIDKNEDEIRNLAEFLKNEKVEAIFPCHCSNLKAKIILSKYVPVFEVSTGDKLSFL